MNIGLIIIGLIILAVVVFAAYRYLIVHIQNRKLHEKRFARIKPLIDKLESGHELTQSEILPFVTDLLTRLSAFQVLNDYKKTALIPKEIYSIEKGAESNLANWLAFPTELDRCPDEMEFVKRTTFFAFNKNAHYYVFKFRTHEPHWAAKNGWMIGIDGPYFDESQPYEQPGGTFSRLNGFETTSADEEAKWVHENIGIR
jgi:hypothetical protein